MSDSLGSWIAKLLVSHDTKYGADFGRVITVNRCCQLIDFPTSRDAQHPHRQIIGTASDQTHTVRVAFDVAATDRFEQPQAVGVPAERLTSHLRAVFLIRKCRIRLTDRPRPTISRGRDRDLSRSSSRASRSTSAITADQSDRLAPAPDVPIVWLDVLDWDVLAGDRNEPTYWENAEEVGMGKGEVDAEVQRVLRKWWTGESNSEPSQLAVTQESPSPKTPNAIAGPSRIPARSADSTASTSPELQSFAHFLEPYLKPPPGKKAKPIPEWIFEVSPETRRELDAIQMFGLELHPTDMVEGGAELRDPAEPSASAFLLAATPSGSTSDEVNPPHLSPPSVPGPNSKAGIHSPISDSTPKHQPSKQEGEDISAASASFPRPGQDTPLTYPQTQGAFPRASQSGQNEPVEQSESEDDDMHIRSFAPINRNRRAGFDPLGFSSPAQMSSPAAAAGIFDASLGYGDEEAARHQYEDMEESQEQEQSERGEEEEEVRDEEETDEEELSSYEREQRRLGMDTGRGTTAADSSPISQWGRAHRPSPSKDNIKHPEAIPVASQQSESLSASQQSHDLSLSRFNKPLGPPADSGAVALNEISTQGGPRGMVLVAEHEPMATGGNTVQMGASTILDNTKREFGSPRTEPTHKRRRLESYTAIPQAEMESNHSADTSSPGKRRRPDIPSQNNGASDESTPVGIQVATQSTSSGRTTFGLGQGLSNVIQRIMSAGRATSVPAEPADRSGSPVKRLSGELASVGVDQRGERGERWDRAGSVFAMLKPWGRGIIRAEWRGRRV